MKNFKKIIQKRGNLIANLALIFSVFAANSRCVCIFHQPSMPKEVKGLKWKK